MTSNVHCVLVEPANSKNVGSVARAMHNLGYDNLSLVSAQDFERKTAAITACQAEPLLDKIQHFETLESALSKHHSVVAFSSTSGRNRRSQIMLEDWVREGFDPSRKTALLFGPERTGLRSEHFPHCESVVRIPSSEENPSYNLAQAVLLVLFSLHMQHFEFQSTAADFEPAAQGQLQQLDKLLVATAKRSGFLREETSEAVVGILQAIFRRTKLDTREAQILLGLFSSIETRFSEPGK